MTRVILIAGPTASGKSSLALRLANDIGGVIINADSMQIYKDLRVISARPSKEEEAEVPHRLYGTVDGGDAYSAAEWCRDAVAEIESAWADGVMPIVVGGTGMYFKVLVDGLAEIPPIPAAVRQQVRDECALHGPGHLHAELSECDPATAARLASADSQRICRAVEVYRATGTPLSEFHKNHKPGPMGELDQKGDVMKLVLSWPRDLLYARCDLRFDLMMQEGGLEEVRAFLERDLPADLPSMKALGVPTLIEYLKGDSSLEDAIENSKMQTRRFAKRQLTWFRNQFSHWNRVDAQQMETKYCEILHEITKKDID
ncbi:tRNA dimethylallyltransferase [Kordiimonas sediminis]|uniref:tRNA dimethylallyltransferase n=1 Tax=Kordiimonas sediminis TaxID=1735581 RepID=A0A919EAP7_9PROT|nr:tRNA (adenosine(37)-N6)-dimethylallyltransferase MiaA [Kordiimonas sediminis]GHF30696.1 tRNA dimethylallyltransferase [Kordiimonas sediminis]